MFWVKVSSTDAKLLRALVAWVDKRSGIVKATTVHLSAGPDNIYLAK